MAFSPDGLRLVSGADDNTVRVWDGASWQPMIGHDDAVQAEFSDDGRRIASGGADKTARWWDAATGRPIGQPLRVDDPDVRELVLIDEDRCVVRLGEHRTAVGRAHPHAHQRTTAPWPIRPPSTGHHSKEAHRIANS